MSQEAELSVSTPSTLLEDDHIDSDSDGYDTDLEELDRPQTLEQESDEISKYISYCERLGVVPVSLFLDSMNSSAVTLAHRGLCDLGVRAVAKALVANATILELRLPYNSINSQGALYLSRMLPMNGNLTLLDLANNKIGGFGLRHIVSALVSNRSLEVLDLSNNAIIDEDGKKLKLLLSKNRCLRSLSVCQNSLSEDAGLAIADGLIANCTLEILDLTWNCIRGEGARRLAFSICRNTQLKKLLVGWNGFADDGAICFGHGLQENSSLEELDLSRNRIGDVGARGLAEGIANNKTLRCLRLGWNAMGSKGVREVISAVPAKRSSRFMELHLNGFFVAQESKNKMDDLLRRKPQMQIFVGGYRNTDSKRFDEDAFRKEVITILKEYLTSKRLRMVDLFNQWDKDKSFSITRQEFRNGVKSCRIPLSETQLNILVHWLDQDGSDSIEYPEFVSITDIE